MKIRRYNKAVKRKSKFYRINNVMNNAPIKFFWKLFFIFIRKK